MNQLDVKAAYHDWMRANRIYNVSVFENYVERLCRFVTLEIEAGRMFWSYELPADSVLKAWFNEYRKGRKGISKP